MHTLPLLALGCIVAAIPSTLTAQKPPGQPVALHARSFFPADYTFVWCIDGELIRKTSLYEVIEASIPANMWLRSLLVEYGIRGLDIDRLTMAGIQEKPTEEEHFHGWRHKRVVAFQSSRPLALPPPKTETGWASWQNRVQKTVAGHTVVQEGEDSEEPGFSFPVQYWFKTGEKSLVYGDRDLIESVLRGERRGGVPHPELMASIGGRNVALSIAGRFVEFSPEYLSEMAPIPFDWYTEADKPTLLMFRVEIDPETEAMRLSLTARFESGTAGPKRFEEKLRAAVAESGEHAVLRLLKPFFARLEYRIDGCDLVVAVSSASVEDFLRSIPFEQSLPLLLGWSYAAHAVAGPPAAGPPAVAMPVVVLEKEGEAEEEEEEEEEEVEVEVEEEKKDGEKQKQPPQQERAKQKGEGQAK